MSNTDQPLNRADDTLLEFPCEFPLKIFGHQHEAFAQTMLELMLKHDPDFVAERMEMRASRNARFISLTCVITATSKPQLDAIYRELSGHPMVKMVL